MDGVRGFRLPVPCTRHALAEPEYLHVCVYASVYVGVCVCVDIYMYMYVYDMDMSKKCIYDTCTCI